MLSLLIEVSACCCLSLDWGERMLLSLVIGVSACLGRLLARVGLFVHARMRREWVCTDRQREGASERGRGREGERKRQRSQVVPYPSVRHHYRKTHMHAHAFTFPSAAPCVRSAHPPAGPVRPGIATAILPRLILKFVTLATAVKLALAIYAAGTGCVCGGMFVGGGVTRNTCVGGVGAL